MNFKEYIETEKVDPLEFALKSGLCMASIYRYMRGEDARLKTKFLIEEVTEGKVKVRDWVKKK
jgi:predicted transcriptional regulator